MNEKYQLRDAVIEMITLRERGHGPAGWDTRAQAALKEHDAEHAALVAVAEAADLVGKANMRLLEAQRQGDKTAIGNATMDLWSELDRLAAVRAGSEVSK
jgi:hypothetical protein